MRLLLLALLYTVGAVAYWARYSPSNALTIVLLVVSLLAWILTMVPQNRRRIEKFVMRCFGWDIGPYGN